MDVARDDVIWGYKFFLGRDPESDLAIRSHMQSGSFRRMVEIFMASEEYQRRQAIKSTSNKIHPLDASNSDVEVMADEERLAKCVAIIRAAWSHLGEKKPHFSVLTDDQFLPERLPESIDRFWDSGEKEAAEVQRMLEGFGFCDFRNKTCVEYGCGVGRVTMGLAKRFKEVQAYDISLGHLEAARSRALETGVVNACFNHCASNVLAALPGCDFFYSRIVLQHNPPPVISAVVRNAMKCLKQGGFAIFQVPTYCKGYSFSVDKWVSSDHKLDMQMHCIPQRALFKIIDEEGCRVVQVREDGSTGDPARFVSNTFFVERPCR